MSGSSTAPGSSGSPAGPRGLLLVGLHRHAQDVVAGQTLTTDLVALRPG